MYRRILVAVDGSDISNRALEEALMLARDQHSEVRMVHVVNTLPSPASELFVDLDAFRRSALSEGQRVLDKGVALARQAGVHVETELVETTKYYPSTSILEEAKRWSAQVIVMGTHGRSGLSHLLLGSVAEGVVRNAPVPVLLVRGSLTLLGNKRRDGGSQLRHK